SVSCTTSSQSASLRPADARPRRTTTLSHSERWPRRRRYDSSSPCRADRISAESSVRSPNEVGLSRIRVRSWKYYTPEKSFCVPVTSQPPATNDLKRAQCSHLRRSLHEQAYADHHRRRHL